jgi:hypothetical protein
MTGQHDKLNDATWTALARLRMTKTWLTAGLVTEEEVQRLAAAREDPHDEHTRYRLLTAYFRRTERFNEAAFQALIQVLWEDADRIMATSVLQDLAEHPGISQRQFEVVCAIAPSDIRPAVERLARSRRWMLPSSARVDEPQEKKARRRTAEPVEFCRVSRSVMTYAPDAVAGEYVAEGRLYWHATWRESGTQLEEDGAGVAPPETRRLLLDQHGTWGVHVAADARRPKVTQVLRAQLGPSLQDARLATAILPGVIYHGTRGEATLLVQALEQNGIAAKLIEA